MKKSSIILGITGGIAAVKMPQLVTLLQRESVEVVPIMTNSACKIIDPKQIEQVTGHKVYSDLFERDFEAEKVLETRRVDHIEIAGRADLLVVVPATANILGKVANGIADDFLTTTILACSCLVVFYPSMNSHMWSNSVVCNNVSRLKDYGYVIRDPSEGTLACGYEGKGRLAELEVIADEVTDMLQKRKALKGKTVLVTAGGTIEPIDDVRVITNRSSGKMGVALAEAGYLYGARVILLRSRNSVSSRYPLEEHVFETADELESLLCQHASRANICFHVAAVSDFRVKRVPGKISSKSQFSLKLQPREKLYRAIKGVNPKIFLVTFKAEVVDSEDELIEAAQKMLAKEPVDAIVANEIGKSDRGFEADTNEVIVVKRNGEQRLLSLKLKRELAREIIEATIL